MTLSFTIPSRFIPALSLTPSVPRQHQPGQIFWVPAPIMSATALGMRLGFLKEGQDISNASLSIEKLELKDLCSPKEAEKVEFYKRMPIPEIQLSASEDLLIQKVKMRPAILLFKSGINMRRFSFFESGRTSKDVLPNHYAFGGQGGQTYKGGQNV